jgi:hypothetical protein
MDGELRIPVEDLADLILRRIGPAELAEGLWTEETVRASFIDCLANRYAGDSVTDGERREFIRKVQTEIHAVALDEAIRRLNQLETNARTYTDHYRWRNVEIGHYSGLYERYKNTLYEMREKGLLDDEQIEKRLKLHFTPESLREYIDGERDPIVKESVGEQWQESRNFWRDRLMEVLPPPRDSDGTATAAANGDLPVPKDCQARPEGIAQGGQHDT